MRNLIYIVIAFLSFKGICQDPQLQENTWFLSELNIDGDILTPPEVDFDTELVFIGNIIEILNPLCDGSYSIEIESYTGETGFVAGSINSVFGEECSSQNLEEFFQAHGRLIYGDPVTGITVNPFSYIIETNTDLLTLTITNGENNIAIYSNQTLG